MNCFVGSEMKQNTVTEASRFYFSRTFHVKPPSSKVLANCTRQQQGLGLSAATAAQVTADSSCTWVCSSYKALRHRHPRASRSCSTRRGSYERNADHLNFLPQR